MHSQWDAARAHLKRDEVSEAQWRTKMSFTTGRDADDHPHPAAATYSRADYLLTLDGSSQVSADFYAASSPLVPYPTMLTVTRAFLREARKPFGGHFS